MLWKVLNFGHENGSFHEDEEMGLVEMYYLLLFIGLQKAECSTLSKPNKHFLKCANLFWDLINFDIQDESETYYSLTMNVIVLLRIFTSYIWQKHFLLLLSPILNFSTSHNWHSFTMCITLSVLLWGITHVLCQDATYFLKRKQIIKNQTIRGATMAYSGTCSGEALLYVNVVTDMLALAPCESIFGFCGFICT